MLTFVEIAAKVRIVPQPVNSWFQICCDMHERLVFIPQRGAENDAVAEIFVLRAHATKF